MRLPARGRRRPPSASRLAVLVALFLLTLRLAAEATPAGAVAPVTPGGVVRWGGSGIEACSSGERTWDPIGEECFFPIDLRASGTLDIERRREGRSETVTVEVGASPYGEQRLTVPPHLVRLSKANLARAQRESAEIAPLWRIESPRRFSLPLAPPLDPLPEGRRFGVRRVFNGEPRSPHSGVDYSAPQATPIQAVADGVVVLSADHFFGGRSLFVDHGGGLISMYFHLSRSEVAQGENVDRGQTIGAVGATGRAVGPHLHFGLRWHGARIDPTLLLGPPEALPEIGG